LDVRNGDRSPASVVVSHTPQETLAELDEQIHRAIANGGIVEYTTAEGRTVRRDLDWLRSAREDLARLAGNLGNGAVRKVRFREPT
jgi:hypothetical protein